MKKNLIYIILAILILGAIMYFVFKKKTNINTKQLPVTSPDNNNQNVSSTNMEETDSNKWDWNKSPLPRQIIEPEIVWIFNEYGLDESLNNYRSQTDGKYSKISFGEFMINQGNSWFYSKEQQRKMANNMVKGQYKSYKAKDQVEATNKTIELLNKANIPVTNFWE